MASATARTLGRATARTSRLRPRRPAGNATLEQCGERFGVTSERVRQIEAGALRKLRKAILDDPELSAIVLEVFGDNAVAEVRAAGFFEPAQLATIASSPIDLPATIVDAMRVLGPTTSSNLRSATMLPADDVDRTIRGLMSAGIVRARFEKRIVIYSLTEGRAAR
jgi:hypothetical protein